MGDPRGDRRVRARVLLRLRSAGRSRGSPRRTRWHTRAASDASGLEPSSELTTRVAAVAGSFPFTHRREIAMTPRILPLFLALAACPVAAQSPTTCPPPAGITLPELVPIHTAAADPTGGAYGVWAGGRAYKVSFHDGMEFHPRVDDRLAAGTTWKWTTRSIARGGIESI